MIRDPDGDGSSNNSSFSPTSFTTAAGDILAYPRVQGESAKAVEDTQLRFAQALLLANDATDNTPSRLNEPSLRITAVFAPTHGNVSLQTGADGWAEVVFNPDRNYHGQSNAPPEYFYALKRSFIPIDTAASTY